jgi:hypothetical protein
MAESGFLIPSRRRRLDLLSLQMYCNSVCVPSSDPKPMDPKILSLVSPAADPAEVRPAFPPNNLCSLAKCGECEEYTANADEQR